MRRALSRPRRVKEERAFISAFRRQHKVSRFSKHFLGRITEQSLRSRIPTGNYAAQVIAENRFARRFDDGGKFKRALLGSFIQNAKECDRPDSEDSECAVINVAPQRPGAAENAP